MKLSLLPFSNTTRTLSRVLSWDKSTTVIIDTIVIHALDIRPNHSKAIISQYCTTLMPYCLEDADDDTSSFLISIAELINQINAQNLHSLVLRKSILINYGFSSP